MPSFTIGEEHFLLDDRPFRILSGALHYFRVHPEQWADRIRKARLMGLNTIETYVAWNAHAPTPDRFDTDGGLDLGRFLDLIAAEGMHAIVRPGPYICAEWDNGGLPAWLFSDPEVGIRRSEPRYLAAVDRYLEQLAPILVPRQIDRGGPLILVQIENEYGAYGSDKAYLEHLVAVNRRIGLTVPFTTVDQPGDLEAGSLPTLHSTASFGSRSTERLEVLRRHQPTGPLMCSEFWDGWFDSWGQHHHTTDATQSAKDLDDLLAAGASVNIYMFHGGTNFGLTNGANDKGVYQPIATSYDYDAPLDEAGNPTEKYWAFREVLAKHAPVPEEAPSVSPPSPSASVTVSESASLWGVLDALGGVVERNEATTTDALGVYSGFVLYEADVELLAPALLEVGEVRDRAQVFLDGVPIGVLAREEHDVSLALPAAGAARLQLLVEDQGRVDYGRRLGEPKGLIGGVRMDGVAVRGWRIRPLDLDRVGEALGELSPSGGRVVGPAFARARFDVEEAGDLFLDTTGWGKGVAWVNGFCLGRYWSKGPQRTLYVPGPVVRPGANEVVLFELRGGTGEIAFVPRADLGHTEY